MLKNEGGCTIEHKWTDWDAFRLHRRNGPGQTDIEDIAAWTTELRKGIQEATKKIETNESVACVDSRLAHLIEAKKSIKERWKKQRWNRKLRKKVTELNRSIQKHSALLCRQQWDEVCNRIDGSLHQSKAWSLIRHLLDETKTKSYQQNRMAQVMHEAEKSLGKEELIKKLKTQYMPQTETEKHPGYDAGAPNEKLDREITTPEVTQAIRELNSRSAAGPDGISNKALRNLDDSLIEALTKYYKCWQSAKLPMQWKTARTKAGKPPSIETLRPVSLTSCVGNVLEHVLANRWQKYLEEEGLYPDSMIGFRRGLSTQDAMLQLKQEIVENETRDSKVILGLDIQSAFDRVKHSAILAQVSRLNMGE